MKYDVRFACGHTDGIQLYGKTADRERKIAYYEQHGMCSRCYAEQREAEKADKAEANRAAAAESDSKANERGWPSLNGSDKQIAWALQIREEKYNTAQQAIRQVASMPIPADKLAEAIANTNARINQIISTQTSAAWWIDNRQTRVDRLFNS